MRSLPKWRTYVSFVFHGKGKSRTVLKPTAGHGHSVQRFVSTELSLNTSEKLEKFDSNLQKKFDRFTIM